MKTTTDKIVEMQNALLTIKRLMPEVEAELSLMGGVGAAREKPQTDLQKRIRDEFIRTTNLSIKRQRNKSH